MTKRALVTGASGGIGSAIAFELATLGYSVIVCYNSSLDRATSVVDSLPGDGHRAARLVVTDSTSIAEVAAEVDHLDVVVNCAGMTQPVAHDDLEALTDELFDQIFATNTRGAFAVTRAMRPALERADDPVVVNISSVAATTGQGSNVAYCASKAALDSLTRSLGRALAPKIRVMSVSPGFVLGEYAASMPAGVLETQQAATPLQRLASAADVAAAVGAVVTKLKFSTGGTVTVDGGRPLGIN